GTAGDRVRQADARVRVANEQLEGIAALGFGQRLCPEVGRADRVGLVDDGRAPELVAPDGQREAEGQDETDDTQDRRLQRPDWLVEMVRSVTLAPSEHQPDGRGPDHDRDEEEPESPAAQLEEQTRPSRAGYPRSESGLPSERALPRGPRSVGRGVLQDREDPLEAPLELLLADHERRRQPQGALVGVLGKDALVEQALRR